MWELKDFKYVEELFGERGLKRVYFMKEEVYSLFDIFENFLENWNKFNIEILRRVKDVEEINKYE